MKSFTGLFSDRLPGGLSGKLGEAREAAATGGRYFAQSLRLMVGLPNYDAYVAHHRLVHPDTPPMSYDEFFRERQAARYGAGTGRCC